MRTLPARKDLQRERNKLAAKIAAEKMAGVKPMEGTAAISDPVVTPFLNAMQGAGFVLKQTPRSAVQAQSCKDCGRKMAYRFLDGDRELVVCAECSGH